jgi:hypothetical protein
MFCLGCCTRVFGPWGCRERWPFNKWWGRRFKSCVISVLFYIFILILITFNRWFYRRWYTYRKSRWIRDPTSYVVEYPAERWKTYMIFLPESTNDLGLADSEWDLLVEDTTLPWPHASDCSAFAPRRSWLSGLGLGWLESTVIKTGCLLPLYYFSWPLHVRHVEVLPNTAAIVASVNTN